MIKKIKVLPDEIKNIKSENIVFGKNNVIKSIKLGKVKSVIISSDAPKSIKEELKKQSEISEIDIQEFEGSNKELGMFCKRPHGILIIALLNK